LTRSETDVINIDAYNRLAPLYQERVAMAGRYPVLKPIVLDNGDVRRFFCIDFSQYNFELAFIDFAARRGYNGGAMLDIGFGAGHTLRYFSDNGYKTTGIDFSPEMCKVAKSVSPKSEIICDNIFNVNLGTDRFNVIVMSSMLCQLSTKDAKALLAKARGALKMNGRIYASTSIEDNNHSGVFLKESVGTTSIKNPSISRFRTNYTISAFVELLESSGFDIEMPFISSEKSDDTERQFQGYICEKYPSFYNEKMQKHIRLGK